MKTLLICSALLLSGCFPAEGPRQFPTWERTTRGLQVLAECAEADAWVSKSGKEGLGVTLELRGRSSKPCAVSITSARLRVGGAEYTPKQLPDPPMLRLGQHVHAYLAFAFDGDRAWNERDEAELVIAGATMSVSFRFAQKIAAREECEPQ